MICANLLVEEINSLATSEESLDTVLTFSSDSDDGRIRASRREHRNSLAPGLLTATMATARPPRLPTGATQQTRSLSTGDGPAASMGRAPPSGIRTQEFNIASPPGNDRGGSAPLGYPRDAASSSGSGTQIVGRFFHACSYDTLLNVCGPMSKSNRTAGGGDGGDPGGNSGNTDTGKASKKEKKAGRDVKFKTSAGGGDDDLPPAANLAVPSKTCLGVSLWIQ